MTPRCCGSLVRRQNFQSANIAFARHRRFFPLSWQCMVASMKSVNLILSSLVSLAISKLKTQHCGLQELDIGTQPKLLSFMGLLIQLSFMTTWDLLGWFREIPSQWCKPQSYSFLQWPVSWSLILRFMISFVNFAHIDFRLIPWLSPNVNLAFFWTPKMRSPLNIFSPVLPNCKMLIIHKRFGFRVKALENLSQGLASFQVPNWSCLRVMTWSRYHLRQKLSSLLYLLPLSLGLWSIRESMSTASLLPLTWLKHGSHSFGFMG